MPPKKGKRCEYKKEDLVSAKEEVKNGKMSISSAARHFNVPRTTLSDHVRGRVVNFRSPGPQRQLTDDLEECLVDYLIYMSRQNFPLRRTDTRNLIVDLIRRGGKDAILKCRFNLEKGPSDEWFRTFEKRHPELKWSVPQTMDSCRLRQSDEYIFDHFYNLYESQLKRLEIMDKAERLFNCDESGINSHIATREKAYGVRGEQTFQEKVASIDHITVMMCVAADGRILPTFLIYEKNLPTMPMDVTFPAKWMYGTSTNGYMDKELFQEWFMKLFIPNCGKQRPVVLLLDNHDSHLSTKVIDAARENEITLIGFPAHTTHLLQPLDVGVFGEVKKKYNAIVLAAGARSTKSRITKCYFPTTWSNALKQAASPKVIQSAFKRTGLCPFDPTALDSSKLKKRKVANTIIPKGTAVVTRNENVEPITPSDDLCQKCFRYPHPVHSVRQLPPELELSFPLRQNLPSTSGTNATTKPRSTRIVTYGRVITGDEVRTQMQEKEEKWAKTETIRLEKQKKAEAMKATIQEDTMSTCLTPEDSEAHDFADKHSTDIIDESLCFICLSEVPPNLYSGKGGKGAKVKGKRKAPKEKDIDWVFCDHCKKWLHCLCENVCLKDLGETYKCSVCKNKK